MNGLYCRGKKDANKYYKRKFIFILNKTSFFVKNQLNEINHKKNKITNTFYKRCPC